VTLETLNSLYATIYMRHWYRLMGAKIGKGSEISSNLAGRYDLVDVGENNFLGDEVIFGDEEVRRGWMTLRKVKTGDRVFVGNDAVIAGGADLADGTLVGVKSKLPDSLKTGPNETWFGTPAISVPSRQKVDMGAVWTYDPPRIYVIRRAIFEGLHTSLPTAVFITFGYMAADLMADPIDVGDGWTALGIFLAAGVVIALIMVAISAAIKWALMGAYKPVMKPMWSWWAMRTEAVAVLYGGLVGKASLEFTRGTPFLPWLLRVYGTKVGKGVYLDCTDFTEFDCVTIGDFCVFNDHAVLQTHLYEDRVMKVGRIELGRGVSVGANTTVLYDTKVGDFAQLGPLTIVMRGESIPGHSEWGGAPAVPVLHEPAETKLAA
jgi:non-ribosomal peptide synthetase-like protein